MNINRRLGGAGGRSPKMHAFWGVSPLNQKKKEIVHV
jgi:hypothetical protein